jgi:subtilisin family serine protease
VDFAILNKANVINFSLGGPKDKLLTMLIKKAVESAIIVVAAAGNGGSKGKPVFPATLDEVEVIAVSATDSNDRLYELSTRGNYIDVSAPGVDIFSPAPGDRWQVSSGTSMAAAHVSGTVALILQKNPELSAFEVKTLLGLTAVDLGKRGKDKEFGEGRIDAFEALQKLVGGTEARR